MESIRAFEAKTRLSELLDRAGETTETLVQSAYLSG